MAVYHITFKPAGKYFFGNEKGFGFGKRNTNYFIKGEELPLQSTLFGALRYLMLPEKGYDKVADYSNIIGKESFDITLENQEFGIIKKMSPLFLCRGEEWFIPTPFDHNTNTPIIKDKTEYYTPLKNYAEINTLNGKQLYTDEYASKKGTAHSFMSLSDLHLENNLFKSSIQVGINRFDDKDAFFKKEYRVLEGAFAFSVIAETDGEIPDENQKSVLLGQGKTPFSVTISPYSGESLADKVSKAINRAKEGAQYGNYAYFLSDCYLKDTEPEELYKSFLFSNIQTRDYRTFKTKGKSVTKGSSLLHLIKAGSIAIPREDSLSLPDFENAEKAGFNHIVTQKGE